MRRIRSSHQREDRVLTTAWHVWRPLKALLVAAIITGLVGCAEKAPPHRRIPSGKKPAEKEVVRPVTERPAPAAATPQGAVAQSLVARGVTYLDQKNYELAAVRFQDAINVDPRNGEAYYYLALADFYLEQYDVAIGLLEKAMSLLGSDPLWAERIENLRASILVGEPATSPAAEPM